MALTPILGYVHYNLHICDFLAAAKVPSVFSLILPTEKNGSLKYGQIDIAVDEAH